MIQKHLQNNIRLLRAQKALTQDQLAQAVEVSRKTINAIEGGHYAPSVTLAFLIAEVLGAPVSEVFQITDEN